MLVILEASVTLPFGFRALVGMQSLENADGDAKLACASHVQQQLGKLPSDHIANCTQFTRALKSGNPYNLIDFTDWLEEEAECQAMATQTCEKRKVQNVEANPAKPTYPRPSNQGATILHGTSQQEQVQQPLAESTTRRGQTCPFCGVPDGHLSVCPDFCHLSGDAINNWIQEKQCRRCAREHRASNCNLKKLCPKSKGKHLRVLHEVDQRQKDPCTSCLIPSSSSTRVLLKVVKVLLSYRGRNLETYAILDDCSERTMLLASAAHVLGLDGVAESLLLKTVRQGTETLPGSTVTLNNSPPSNADKKNCSERRFHFRKINSCTTYVS